MKTLDADWLKKTLNRPRDQLCAFAFHFGKQCQTGFAFCQETRACLCPLPIIVSSSQSPIRERVSTMAGRWSIDIRFRNSTSVIGRTVTFPALFLTAKMQIEIASLAFVFKNKLVNRFMTDCYLILTTKPSADLLGAPVISQETLDQDPCIWRNSSRDGLCPSNLGKMLGLFRTVSAKATVAAPFSTDCRFVDTDNFGDFGLKKSCFHKCVNLVSLFSGELRVVTHQCSSYFGRLEKHEPTAARLSCQLRRVALRT